MIRKIGFIFLAVLLSGDMQAKEHEKKVKAAMPMAIPVALQTAFQNDNVAGLKSFIANNATFNWSGSYALYGVTKVMHARYETGTPLMIAVLLGAQNCVQYLLSNVAAVKNNISARSSHHYTALQYAGHLKKSKPQAYTSIRKALQTASK